MFELDVSAQAMSFLLSLVFGLGMGLYYCVFKALRTCRAYSRWKIFLQDIIFWVVCAVAAYCFFILRCVGEVRLFVYVGMAMGFAFFRIFFGERVTKIFSLPISGAVKIGAFLKGKIRALEGILETAPGKIYRFWENIIKKMKKWRKKVLKEKQ